MGQEFQMSGLIKDNNRRSLLDLNIKISRDFWLYALIVLSGLNEAFVISTRINTYLREVFLVIGILMLIYGIYCKKIDDAIKIILAVAFFRNEMTTLALPVLMLPKLISFLFSGNLFNEKKPKAVLYYLLFTLYIFSLLFVTQVFEPSFLSLFFWFMITGSGYLIFLYFLNKSYTASQISNILNFFRNLIILQIPILLLQSLIHQQFEPGDFWTGSFGDATKTGFYLVLLLFYFILPFIVIRQSHLKYRLFTVKNILFLFLLVFLLYMNDSKTMLLGTMVSFPLFLIISLWAKIKSKFGTPMLRDISSYKSLVLILMFLTTWGVIYNIADLYLKNLSKGTTDLATSWELYTNSEFNEFGVNNKYIVYKRVFSDMRKEYPVEWLFGVGPGKFGSRSANMLAYDVLFKDPTQFKLPSFIEPYSSVYLKKYMKDMWTAQVAEYAYWRSANLSFPFAGIITIKTELGMLGLTMYVLIFISFSLTVSKKIAFNDDFSKKRWCLVMSYFWIALPVYMVIDNYQEKPQIMIPIFIITSVLIARPVPEPDKV